jgi:protein gp37
MRLVQYQHVTDNGAWNGKTCFAPSELDKPYKWRKPRTVFIGSMGDLFHETVRLEWISAVLDMVNHCQQHTFILLTKRPQNMLDMLEECLPLGWRHDPLPNLILGVSAENQTMADERIRVLLRIPAAKRFVSIEPMLGPVDLYRGGWSFLNALIPPPGNKGGWKRGLDGVILGGEKCGKARLLNPQWVRLVRDQCKEAAVPFMFKQWGNNVLQENGRPWEYNFANGFPDLDGKEHSALAW